jgi:hypothetical protein
VSDPSRSTLTPPINTPPTLREGQGRKENRPVALWARPKRSGKARWEPAQRTRSAIWVQRVTCDPRPPRTPGKRGKPLIFARVWKGQKRERKRERTAGREGSLVAFLAESRPQKALKNSDYCTLATSSDLRHRVS